MVRPGAQREEPSGALLFGSESISNQFISENGIVAVFGDENQSLRGDIRKSNFPPLTREGAYRPDPR